MRIVSLITFCVYCLLFPSSSFSQQADVPSEDYVITSQRQAGLLKVRFLQRKASSVKQIELGWEELSSAIQLTPPETLSWFWLQNIRAFGAYRLPFVQPSEGAAAYSAIFDAASRAPQAKAEDVVRISLNEYLFFLNHQDQFTEPSIHI